MTTFPFTTPVGMPTPDQIVVSNIFNVMYPSIKKPYAFLRNLHDNGPRPGKRFTQGNTIPAQLEEPVITAAKEIIDETWALFTNKESRFKHDERWYEIKRAKIMADNALSHFNGKVEKDSPKKPKTPKKARVVFKGRRKDMEVESEDEGLWLPRVEPDAETEAEVDAKVETVSEVGKLS